MRVNSSKTRPSASSEQPAEPVELGSRNARRSDKRFGLKQEYAAIAKQICELGGTTADLAKAFRVTLDKIALWQSTDKEFAEACRVGVEFAEQRVERALYERAVGYTQKVDTVVKQRHGISIVQRKVHVPADPRAGKIWLERRQADAALTRESPIEELRRQLMGTALRPKPQD